MLRVISNNINPEQKLIAMVEASMPDAVPVLSDLLTKQEHAELVRYVSRIIRHGSSITPDNPIVQQLSRVITEAGGQLIIPVAGATEEDYDYDLIANRDPVQCSRSAQYGQIIEVLTMGLILNNQTQRAEVSAYC